MTRWGVVGTGAIANRFADAMTRVEDGEIAGVTSREIASAHAFGDRWDARGRFTSLDAMLADPAVEAVYVATPHMRHVQDAVHSMEAQKPVLCEKPMATNAAEVQRMLDAAAANGVFLMEAIWSRFLPAYRTLSELLDAGAIGRPLQVEAEFGFVMPEDRAHRLFDPGLGGGATLDLGIYPLQLCTSVLGPVRRVAAAGTRGGTGVDTNVAVALEHEGGGVGIAKASLTVGLHCTARIYGTEGRIDLPAFMHAPSSLTIWSAAGQQEVDCPIEGDGLEYEIREVHRCLEAGLIESPTMPWEDSLTIAEVMDAVLEQVGGGRHHDGLTTRGGQHLDQRP